MGSSEALLTELSLPVDTLSGEGDDFSTESSVSPGCLLKNWLSEAHLLKTDSVYCLIRAVEKSKIA